MKLDWAKLIMCAAPVSSGTQLQIGAVTPALADALGEKNVNSQGAICLENAHFDEAHAHLSALAHYSESHGVSPTDPSPRPLACKSKPLQQRPDRHHNLNSSEKKDQNLNSHDSG